MADYQVVYKYRAALTLNPPVGGSGMSLPMESPHPPPVSAPSAPPQPGNRHPRQTLPREPVTYGCGGCDNRWSGISRCHCSRCHITLSGIGLFDAHQRNGKCLDPAAMDVRGESLRLMNGVWCGPEMPADALARRRADQ